MDIFGPAVLTVLLFNVLQRMEDWLHQHVFKVGWLVTKNFQTTTILYYTFFLPGVVLYEFVRYLVAGTLNVRAERAIAFPESQEIAELRLNFIRLSRKAPGWKIFVIQAAPPTVGLLLIYLIALNVFDIEAIFATLAPSTPEAVINTFTRLFATPDFWLWAYLVFTISGVTIPNWIVISGWRSILITVGGVAALLFGIGVAENVSAALIPSVSNGLNALSLLFALMLILNGIGIALLSAVENSIERVTGDSATFRNGKLVALRRSEIRALREQEREKSLRVRQQQREKPALPAGPPSIYRMPFAIPGPPGEEVVTRAAARIIEPEERTALPERPRRDQPDQISAEATVISSSTSSPHPANRPPPLFNPSRAGSRIDDDDEIEEDDLETDLDEDSDDESDDQDTSSTEPVYEDVEDAPYADDDEPPAQDEGDADYEDSEDDHEDAEDDN